MEHSHPDLSVKRSLPKSTYEQLGYWPNYKECSSTTRAIYLDFLANGAQDSGINIGYVFLYYYGLERRLLVDLADNGDSDERQTLITEVLRLLELYRENNSFRRYATNLLSLIALKDNETANRIIATSGVAQLDSEQLLWLNLGRTVKAGEAVNADLAMQWLRADPEMRFRTPAKRLPDAFDILFKANFDSEYPNGLQLKPNKSQLSIGYYPASAGLRGLDFTVTSDLPNLSRISRPLPKLRAIADSVMDMLEPYSRLIGRDEKMAATLAGMALLPPLILKLQIKQDPLKSFAIFLHKSFSGKRRVVIPARDLLGYWPLKDASKVAKQESVGLAQLLEKFTVGIEPDIRFGPMKIKPEGQVCLYRKSEKGGQTAAIEYSGATAFLHLAAMMAAADGTIDDQERWHMEQHLKAHTGLEVFERERLDAHLEWLLAEQPGLGGMKKRIENLSAEKIHALGRFLGLIAVADGHADPSEIKLLEKIYKMAGLEPKLLHADLHEIQAGLAGTTSSNSASDDFATLPLGDGKTAPAFTIPAQEQPIVDSTQGGFQLDISRIEQIQAQSASVHSILCEVFADQDEQELPASTTAEEIHPASDLPPVPQLDGAHLQLFYALREASSMARDHFDDLCLELKLMPEGALELINDTAYELIGEPLLEGDDPIEIDHQIAQEMMA